MLCQVPYAQGGVFATNHSYAKVQTCMAETQSWFLSRGAIGRSRRDLAIRSLRRQASTAKFLFRKSVNDIPRPGSALKDKRTLTAGGGKKEAWAKQKQNKPEKTAVLK